LFVSQALLDQAVDEAPALFDGRSEVLHDGVQPQPSWTAEDSIRCRRELDLPEDRTIVAMAGQIAEIKGIWDFVDAARILSSHAPESLFVVVGDDLKNGGQTRRAMEARVAALGLTARFRFLGFRTDVPRVVQAFDIIAVPSHIEPLGNATLEAMATGRPVVGSRVGGIPEMVIDGETGALVPPRDPTALAHAIARLIDDRALRMRMGAAAKQRATMKFSIEAHGERLQCLYDSMCASPVVRFGSRTEAA
jgi:glycosyltransferase involved in cell wall biosynthesis